ncbi:MAG: S41 family peptidase [Bacteroidota bacterium]
MRTKLLLLSTFVLLACENILVNDEIATDQTSIFNLFWEDYNRNYAGFVVRNIDWDSTRSSALTSIKGGLSEEEFFELLGSIVVNFEDIHAEIIDTHGRRIRYSPKNPSSISMIGPLNDYLISARKAGEIFTYGNIINEEIGYIQIPTFSSRFSLNQYEQIDIVIRNLGNIKGLVLDLRNNGGGQSDRQKTVTQRFVKNSFTYIQGQFRNGCDHNNFDPPISDDISPGGSIQFTGPTVILANRASGSSAEVFVMTLETQEHIMIVGDTTAGGLGLNTWRELPNGWNYRMTLTLTSNGDGISYEAQGIPPHEVVFFTKQDSIDRVDPQLDRAIELLL